MIGAGISGLVAALKLRARHAVTLFKANDYIGGHTNTIYLQLEGEQHAIDTGFIVFNNRRIRISRLCWKNWVSRRDGRR